LWVPNKQMKRMSSRLRFCHSEPAEKSLVILTNNKKQTTEIVSQFLSNHQPELQAILIFK